MGALRTIDATGMTVVPLTDEKLLPARQMRSAGVEVNDRDDHRRRSAGADRVLKPAPQPGKFVVESVLR